MTKKEAEGLIFICLGSYANHPLNKDSTKLGITIDSWSTILEPYSFQEAKVALLMFIRNDKAGFAPAPGQIIEYMEKIKNKQDELTELEAWGIVYKAACNSMYHAEEEFERLPENIRLAIGNSDALKTYAMIDLEREGLQVAASNFMRSYRTILKRKENSNQLIIGSGLQIESRNEAMIESKDEGSGQKETEVEVSNYDGMSWKKDINNLFEGYKRKVENEKTDGKRQNKDEIINQLEALKSLEKKR